MYYYNAKSYKKAKKFLDDILYNTLYIYFIASANALIYDQEQKV